MESSLYIPFGTKCSITHYLRDTGRRKEAYPFDWNLTPLPSAIQLLGNGFAHFLERDSLIFLPPVERRLFEEDGVELRRSEELITPVICRRYGILFPHDFSADGEDDYPESKRSMKAGFNGCGTS